MMSQVRSDAEATMRDQKMAIAISAVLTVLASVLGLLFAMFARRLGWRVAAGSEVTLRA
jgi:hypothetical protein